VLTRVALPTEPTDRPTRPSRPINREPTDQEEPRARQLTFSLTPSFVFGSSFFDISSGTRAPRCPYKVPLTRPSCRGDTFARRRYYYFTRACDPPPLRIPLRPTMPARRPRRAHARTRVVRAPNVAHTRARVRAPR